jgi:hypothetical protein
MNRSKHHLTYENPPHLTTFLHSTSPVRNSSRPSFVPDHNVKRLAGLFSSLVSHLVNARLVYPRLVSKLVQIDKTGTPGVISKISSRLSSAARSSARPAADAVAATAATPAILGSLGASGAIYSTVLLSALAFPDAEVALVFPPTPSFPIQYGVGGFVLLDCIGILRGWRYATTLISYAADVNGLTIPHLCLDGRQVL